MSHFDTCMRLIGPKCIYECWQLHGDVMGNVINRHSLNYTDMTLCICICSYPALENPVNPLLLPLCFCYVLHVYCLSPSVHTCIHVIAPPVDSSTVFLGDGGGLDNVEITCSPPYNAHQYSYTWYHNGEIIENHTHSSLMVNKSVPDTFGVYQCFSAVHPPHVIDEISITRVLPFGECVCMQW